MATYIDGRSRSCSTCSPFRVARGRHSVVPKSMRVLSHPRVRSPLGFAASTWFFQNRSFAPNRTRFHLPFQDRTSSHAATEPAAGGVVIFVLGGLPRRRAAAGGVSSALRVPSPLTRGEGTGTTVPSLRGGFIAAGRGLAQLPQFEGSFLLDSTTYEKSLHYIWP